MNEITPGAPIGGDPVKALALKEQFVMSVTTATVLSAKLGQAPARVLFIVLTLLTVAWTMKLDRLPVKGLGVGFLLTAAGLAGFTALQLNGLSRPAIKALGRLGFPSDWLEQIGALLENVDKHLSELYERRAGDLIASVALALGGLCVGLIQVWLIMQWIGHPCDLFVSPRDRILIRLAQRF